MTFVRRRGALLPVALALVQVLASLCMGSPIVRAGCLTVHVPRSTCRFDVLWRSPPRPKLLSLKESRGRVLYSGVKESVSDGLGHGMATTNADISTALRLGLSYTHRVAKYGSLVGQSFKDEVLSGRSSKHRSKPTIAGLSDEAGRIEGFFGWGVGEIPREAVQDAACPSQGALASITTCKLCTSADLARTKKEHGKLDDKSPGLRVDHIVEIPMSLSYMYPHTATSRSNATLASFLKRNNKPYTVFHMPHAMCAKSPAYSRFAPSSRSFFFHKYWDAHSLYPIHDPRKPRQIRVFPSLRMYRSSWATTLRIPGIPSRGRLPRLKEHELTIAIHARRGDFFKVGRPMVSTQAFSRVVRKVVSEIIRQNGTFASMPVAVNIYSEGRPKKGFGEGVGHDVTRLTRAFQDVDGKVLDKGAVTRILKDDKQDKLGRVFKNGLRVALRVSEDTVKCLHEMIAADVFVGSMSGMSLHLVGSLSRGAMQILPARLENKAAWHGHIKFEPKSGEISKEEFELVGAYWADFERANQVSARRAFDKNMEAKKV